MPPSGEPICETPDEAHSLLTVGPRTNHAPASAASQAPNAAKARLALLSKIRPPAAVATPGNLQPQPGGRVHPQGAGSVGELKIGPDERDECPPGAEHHQHDTAERAAASRNTQHASHAEPPLLQIAS